MRTPLFTALLAVTAVSNVTAVLAEDDGHADQQRAALPRGAIEHILVIDLENESYAATFGSTSPAIYLNTVLLQRGELVPNYFATSHVSLGNYTSQVSGQGTNPSLNNDCLALSSLSHPPVVGGFTDIVPGLASTDPSFPGQVLGDGCVFPMRGGAPAGVALTIGDQLDAARHENDRDNDGDHDGRVKWREYAEDMGNNPARDYGTPDPMGGTDCAHPPIGGADLSNSASATDQYATRHNPFVYFHSVIDDTARCARHVVPLGMLVVGKDGAADQFSGHLYQDLRTRETTPRFMFVTPNLCNDGHDATCAGPNVEGTKDANGKNAGGLVSADLWLKHWMPMIFDSPAYRSGKMLVVLTFDESGFTDARACEKANQADCGSPGGPNVTNPGYSPVLGIFHLQTPPTTPYQYAGGGQVGAVLFNARYIEPGTVNTTGSYNHFSALRSYEDLLGIEEGGDDGHGHIGFAALPTLRPFGADVFNRRGR
jgi:phosphatidylinositol-3-phosphatase